MRYLPPVQRAYLQTQFSLALMLPLCLLKWHMTLIAVFGILLMSVTSFLHSTRLPSNPFTAYTDIFPGQPSSNLDAHGFLCLVHDPNYYHDPSETKCVLSLETGAFSNIEVTYSRNTIQSLHFDLRRDELNFGNLAVLLKLSEFRSSGYLKFTWQGISANAKIDNPRPGRISMLSRVWQVDFTNMVAP